MFRNIFKKNSSTKNSARTVYVGLSGGVDSAVSAALLKDTGYNVVGCFIKTWAPDGYPCPAEDDKRQSMRVAAHLRIPWIEIDAEDAYKNNVAQYLLNEYKAGRTPNGDIFCNTTVKFGTFYDVAMAHGADYIATGHYAMTSPPTPLLKLEEGFQQTNKGVLYKGIDITKDQTYFLWKVPKEKLAKTLFPVGNIPKNKVRELAKKYKLPNAERPDSQGVCFLGPIDMKQYLKDMLKPVSGNVLDTSGNIIGTHDGAILYTTGERHGFNITAPHTKPYFVMCKNANNNTITVHESLNMPVNQNKIYANQINNLTNESLQNKEMNAVFRYHGEEYKIKLDPDNKIVFLNQDTILVAEGQSVVFYDGNQCLGGGIISYSK